MYQQPHLFQISRNTHSLTNIEIDSLKNLTARKTTQIFVCDSVLRRNAATNKSKCMLKETVLS